MTPEELQAILDAAQRARQRGASPAEVNTLIQKHTGLRNMPALMTAARGGTPTPEQQAPPSMQEQAVERAAEHSPFSNFVRMLTQGASLETGDELAGVAAALGTLRKGGSPKQAFEDVSAASRQRVEDISAASPTASALTRGAGALATGLLPVGKAFQIGSKAKGLLGIGKASKAAKLAASGSDEAAKIAAATAGKFRPGIQSAKEIGTSLLKGGSIGAAEGAVLGAGSAESGERLRSAAQLGVAGGALGAGLAGTLKSLASVPSLLRNRGILRRARNPRIASRAEDAVASSSGARTLPSETLDRMADQRKLVQQQFKKLEKKRGASHELRVVLNQPIIQAQDLGERLRKMGRENVFTRVLSDRRPLQFEDAQDIRAALQDKIDSAFRSGENQLAHRLAEQKRNLDSAIGNLFEDQSARRAWRELSMVPDALEEGMQAATMAPDKLRQTLRQFQGHPEANAAFRVGMVRKMLDDIAKKSGSGAVRPSQQMIDKMRLAVGEDATDQIIGIMREEGVRESREKAIEFAIKGAGFLVGGTSLLGGAVLTGFGG